MPVASGDEVLRFAQDDTGRGIIEKLVNDPRRVVREMLEGVCDLHPGLALLADFDVVGRADLPPPEQRAVAVISGGGSGHEPAQAGYVGPGLLAAATAAMRPHLGRASYLGDRVIGKEDGGARAVAIWLRALAAHLTN
jgi:dihydroxyacetone kinase